MKIEYASDLHLEFKPIDLKNENNADVLILAGDILIAKDLGLKYSYTENQNNLAFHKFFNGVCEQYKDVIYIFGNHEYYHGDFAKEIDHVKKCFSYIPNLHILDKESIVINGITFICGTMWTDFNKNDPIAMYRIQKRMNDFYIIKNSDKTINGYTPAVFTPNDAYDDYIQFINFTNSVLSNTTNDVVMVTHHCPSTKSVPEKYAGDLVMNPGYVSNMDDFILNNPKIKKWICGHSHTVKEYKIGDCDVLMNCRGYPSEDMFNTFKLKSFEI